MNIDFNHLYGNVCTDTRKYDGESLFIAIPGENFNPLEHIKPVLNQEKLKDLIYLNNETNSNIVKNYQDSYPKINFIKTDDFFKTFNEVAQEFRRTWKNSDNKLIAITGSNGKTTVKEMIFHILHGLYPNKVIKTLSNNNNHIGVPLTIFDIKKDTKYAVIELGSNAPGEIKSLCEISEPDCAITTNIGYTHMEFFPTLDSVFQEESIPYHYIDNEDNNFYLINKMDPFLSTLKTRKQDITIGFSNVDYEITINSNNIGFTAPISRLITNENLLGRHNFVNLAMAISICHKLESEKMNEILELAQSFKPGLNRSEWKDYKESRVFLDAYNANPSSMIASLEGFKDHNPSRSLVVIGDMNELGDFTEEGHKKVGSYLRECGFKDVVFVGRYADYYLSEYPFAERFASASEYKKVFDQKISDYEFVFLKASRTLKLEELISTKG